MFPHVLFQSHGAKLYRVPKSSPLTFFSKLFVISHEKFPHYLVYELHVPTAFFNLRNSWAFYRYKILDQK